MQASSPALPPDIFSTLPNDSVKASGFLSYSVSAVYVKIAVPFGDLDKAVVFEFDYNGSRVESWLAQVWWISLQSILLKGTLRRSAVLRSKTTTCWLVFGTGGWSACMAFQVVDFGLERSSVVCKRSFRGATKSGSRWEVVDVLDCVLWKDCRRGKEGVFHRMSDRNKMFLAQALKRYALFDCVIHRGRGNRTWNVRSRTHKPEKRSFRFGAFLRNVFSKPGYEQSYPQQHSLSQLPSKRSHTQRGLAALATLWHGVKSDCWSHLYEWNVWSEERYYSK